MFEVHGGHATIAGWSFSRFGRRASKEKLVLLGGVMRDTSLLGGFP